MKKVILVLGILFILLAAGAVGVLLYANRYVQSPAFKERLVAEISKVTGGTVQIDTINVSLTSRVEVGGIKMDLGDAKQGSQAFTTKNFLVKFNPWGLLRKKIEVEEILFDSPEVRIVSAPKAPAPPVPGEAPTAPSEIPGQFPLPETAQAPPSKPAETPAPQAPSVSKPAIDLVIRKAEVRNGKLDITMPDGARILLENFNLVSTFQETDGPLRFGGRATCESVILDNQPPITGVDADFHFEKDTLFIEKAKGTAFRGIVEADGQAKIDEQYPFSLHAFSFHVKATNLDLKALLEKMPGLAQAVEGTAHASADVEGNFESPIDATGKGFAEVKGGHITTKSIQFLMFTYQIPELQVITLTKCETDFTLGGRKVRFSRIEALSPDVHFDATGWYDLEQKAIDFNLHPSISDAVKNRLPLGIATGLQPEPDGFSSLAFRWWGPLDNLQDDLKSKFAEGVVDNFFASQVPQNIINNTFDKLEGMIKGKPALETGAPSGEKKPSLLESIFGSGSGTNSAPAEGETSPPDGSTNAAPKKGLIQKLEKLF